MFSSTLISSDSINTYFAALHLSLLHAIWKYFLLSLCAFLYVNSSLNTRKYEGISDSFSHKYMYLKYLPFHFFFFAKYCTRLKNVVEISNQLPHILCQWSFGRSFTGQIRRALHMEKTF